jgi:5-methyltetrahydropteroyltriglutamate--homocysteine methyltransferase
MNKVFLTQEIGSLRKPFWLLKVTRDKKASKEEKKRVRDDAAFLNIKMFEHIGLDFVYDGEVRRIEMYEYPIRRIGGFEFCGNVRSFNNKFYKKARCISKVKYRGCYHLEEFLFVKRYASKNIKVPITGPYTLADWSYNEYYSTKDEFVLDLARSVINPLIKDLVNNGAKYIQIDEPAATTHPNEVKLFVEAFNKAVKGINAKFIVHICYSNYSLLFPHIAELKAQQLALEFANRDSLELGDSKEIRKGYEQLYLFKEYSADKEVGVGVIDAHSDFIEPPTLIKDRILFASKLLGDFAKVYVNPDCGLRTRERSIAFAKLKNMVRGAKLARDELR